MLEATTNRWSPSDDVDAASFKEVLKYLYCGRFPNDMASSPESFLPIAEKYDIQALKDACSGALAEKIKKENIVDVLIMAHVFRCPKLKAIALNRLKKWKKSMTDEALEPLKAHPELTFECLKAL